MNLMWVTAWLISSGLLFMMVTMWWLLMTWQNKKPGHHKPWYWCSLPGKFFSIGQLLWYIIKLYEFIVKIVLLGLISVIYFIFYYVSFCFVFAVVYNTWLIQLYHQWSFSYLFQHVPVLVTITATLRWASCGPARTTGRPAQGCDYCN